MSARLAQRSKIASGLFALLLSSSALSWAAPPPDSGTSPAKAPGQAPKSQIVEKFVQNCVDKSAKDANCEKLRKESVDILKEDVLRLGSKANRKYMPGMLRMFWSDEVELRIAAADAIGMIGPQDQDLDVLAPLTNDLVPDVRHAVSNMLRQGKGKDLTLLKERTIPMRMGGVPEKPADATKFGLPVMPNSVFLFDSSDVAVGRLSYVTKNMNEVTAFYKGKAKKGPFPLQEFKDKYRYQFQDEDEAMRQAQEAAGKEIENTQPPDPTNVQAYAEFMQKIASVGARQGSRIYLDAYQPNLFGSPTVYVLEERQIGQRSYPTRYVVLYQEQAFKRPGYRLSWMTVPDDAVKTVQAASLAEEKEELARNKEDAALKKRGEALEDLVKKKDEQEKKNFKKGQADLEKELGF